MNPLDFFTRRPSKPAARLLGGSYRPAAYPVLVGHGKCRKKGHRPPSKRDFEAGLDFYTCTRCGQETQMPARASQGQ